ncbi:glycosyltransferase [Virgibacillus oceani]
MKKNIIFMVINMNVGGTERALLNMIAEMPKDTFDITILMLEKYGGFLESIPSYVQVQYLDGYQDIKKILNRPPKETIMKNFKNGKVIKGLSLLLILFLSRLTRNKGIFFKYVLKNIPNLKTEYDIALAYAGPMDFISYFVVNKIKAKKRVQWIHFDVTKIGFNKVFSRRIYQQYDKLFIVSKEARNKLINLIPNIDIKTEVFLNIVSPEIIERESKKGKGFDDYFKGFRIFTVGRLSNEKGQDLAIEALTRLVNEGFDVNWYCLGEGSSRHKYEKLVQENKLEDRFILLGSNPNPYSFMEQCDIYVQPSRHEGYCLTIAEARALKKPIVTTATAGAKEQIRHGETGLIVDIDSKEIYQAIKQLIENTKLRNDLTKNLKTEKLDNPFNIDDKNLMIV